MIVNVNGYVHENVYVHDARLVQRGTKALNNFRVKR
jgi:hypothetical protein